MKELSCTTHSVQLIDSEDDEVNFTIRAITRYEYSWITSETFHSLYSQLTKCNLLSKSEYEEWFSKVHESPYFQMFGVIKSTKDGTLPQIVGIGSMWLDPKYYRNKSISARIEDVVVDRKYRGKGLGKALLRFMMDKAKENKCYKITLHCSQNNVKFYEKLGFTEGIDMIFK